MMLFAGFVAWTLVQYWGHRGWHIYEARGSQQFFAVGEREHHRLWPVMGLQQDDDHLSPPMWAPIGLGVAAGLLISGWFGVAFLVGFFWDHYLHRWIHQGHVSWFADFHAAHHISATGNFGVSAGLLWDRVFGTYLGGRIS